ncbi:MAG: hypothetical protein ABIE22_00440 [archaeon]
MSGITRRDALGILGAIGVTGLAVSGEGLVNFLFARPVSVSGESRLGTTEKEKDYEIEMLVDMSKSQYHDELIGELLARSPCNWTQEQRDSYEAVLNGRWKEGFQLGRALRDWTVVDPSLVDAVAYIETSGGKEEKLDSGKGDYGTFQLTRPALEHLPQLALHKAMPRDYKEKMARMDLGNIAKIWTEIIKSPKLADPYAIAFLEGQYNLVRFQGYRGEEAEFVTLARFNEGTRGEKTEKGINYATNGLNHKRDFQLMKVHLCSLDHDKYVRTLIEAQDAIRKRHERA